MTQMLCNEADLTSLLKALETLKERELEPEFLKDPLRKITAVAAQCPEDQTMKQIKATCEQLLQNSDKPRPSQRIPKQQSQKQLNAQKKSQ